MNNVAVLEKVLGFTRKENWNGVFWEKSGLSWLQVPSFYEERNDLLVLRHVHEHWRWYKWTDHLKRFYDRLGELLRERDPYLHGSHGQPELYYIENYKPGDYARAALYAVGEE